MPTVIDSLVVELGLDPKNFNQEQKDALANFKRTQDEAAKGAKATEDAGRRVALSVGDIQRSAIAMFAAFTGGKGLMEFAVGNATANADLGRLSRSLGVSAGDIGRWQGVARLAGGDAKQMAASFTQMSDTFVGFSQGDDNGVIQTLRRIMTLGGVVIDVTDTVDEKFKKLGENFKNIAAKSPETASYYSRHLGLDPSLYAIISQGRDGTDALLKRIDNIGVATKEATAAAEELQSVWSEFVQTSENRGRSWLETLAPEIKSFLNYYQGIISGKGDFIKEGSLGDQLGKGVTRGFRVWGALAGLNEMPQDPAEINPDWFKPTLHSRDSKPSTLRVKPGAGYMDPTLGSIAEKLQARVPDLNRVTSFNDQYHAGTNSAHARNQAFDVTVSDPARSAEIAAKVRQQLAEMGLTAKVIDEYKNPSGRATGGHLHVQMLNKGTAGGGTKIDINGPITVMAPAGANAEQFAEAFRASVLARQSETAQANTGQE